MISCYKKIILSLSLCAIFPAQASLLWNLNDGADLYNRANYKEAKAYFINYLKNNPNDEKGYYYLAETYLKLKNSYLSTNNFEKAYDILSTKKNLEKIEFKKDTQTLHDYFDMAVMYFEDANFQEADYYADLMIKMDSKDSSAWFLKAKIAYSKGNKEEAVEYLKTAILYNPKLLKTNLAKKLKIYSIPAISKEQYYSFAFEDYFRGDTQSAIRNCLNYLETDKENSEFNPEISILLAKLYLMKNSTDKALEVIENAKKRCDNIDLYLLEAEAFDKEDKFIEEEKSLLKAYKINPNNIEMLQSLGNFYLKKGDFKNSLKYFEILINTDDSLYEAYFGYIKSMIENGKTNNSLNFIRKATALNPEQSEIDYLLCLICFKQGQFKEARDYIEEAISKQKNANYLMLKAKILYYQKEYNKSLNTLSELSQMSQKVYNQAELNEYYIKNNLKLKNYQNAQYYINNEKYSLDKNSLLYKYILYNLYKTEGNDKKADFLYNQMKLSKPDSIKEYVDLSEIIFDKEGQESSIKFLDKAIKKMPDEYELYSQKIKIYSFSDSLDNIKEILNETEKIFN